MRKLALAALGACLAGIAAAGGNLLPDAYINEICQKRNTGVTYLKAEGAMPEGVLVTADKAVDPIFKIETSGAVPCAVKKGDLVSLTACVRGKSPSGKVSVLVKLQDSTYTGALRANLTGGETWRWCRITGKAPKDFAAGTMRLHVYPWTGCQQAELRGWKLENHGPVEAASLPPLPAAPDWPAGELKSPAPPPPPKPVELTALTPEQYAKKRYVMLKFDDVHNNKGNIHPKFVRVADYLKGKGLKGGFGVIVKDMEQQPNAKYVEWIKSNAIENGGSFEFWNHGWDHAMFFNCTEDDDCDRTVKYHGEHATGLQHQRKHLAMAIDTFKKHTGLTFHTLGTAGNAGNADTMTALRDHPEIKVWMFGQGKSDDVMVLGRWLNLEHAVGKVSYDEFVKNYQRNRQKDYVVLQGHCAMWSDEMFEDFKRIVELLDSEGWLFVTPYEFYRIQKGELQPPAQKPQAAVVEKTVITAGADWIPLKAAPVVEKGSALDFSGFRETGAPAGRFGRVVRKGPHFEFADRPGKPVRFYGVNLCFGANYPEYEEAKALAANLARIGYNAVRIHHHDGQLVKNRADSTDLDPVELKRLDGLIAACVEEGLYLTTDLFVSRPVSWKAMGFDKPGKPVKDVYKVLVPIHDGARKNYLDYCRKFLNHVNSYTGRRYADEPALVTLALINEGNLMNWGGKLLKDLEPYQSAWKLWLAERKASEPAVYGKVPDTIPENAYGWGEHTPAFTQFLREVETKFCNEMRLFLRNEIKTDVLITNLSCWWNPVTYQKVRSDGMDLVDDHFYVDHPSFLEGSWGLPSKCANKNPIVGGSVGMTDVAFRRLLDRPFTITEYNYAGPGRFRGVGGIVAGAIGALQDWDGLWRFSWAHDIDSIRNPGSKPMGYFNMADDPLSLAAERASICLYLRRDLPALDKTFAMVLPPKAMETPDPKQHMSKGELKWIAWYARFGSLVADAAPAGTDWSLTFPDAYEKKSPEVQKMLFKNGKRPTTAGNGHVEVDNQSGTFLLKTAKTCGGFAEGGVISAEALVAKIDSPATVWASTLDGKDIAKSSRLLVTHLTDLQNTGITYRDPELTILEKWGSLPYLMRRGKAEVSLRVREGEWSVNRLDAAGKTVAQVPSRLEGGVLTFTADTAVDPQNATYLYELTCR